jgi:acetyltransferase-like isoleucine patch superfamily enzyme
MIAAATHIDSQSGNITIGRKSTLHAYAMLIANGGDITVGAGFSVNPFSILYSGKTGLVIGENVRIAAHVVIIPENHNFYRLDLPIRFQGRSSKGVSIGSDVWIGTGVKILDGAVIGDGCVIGANAVVLGEIPPYSVAVGIPARPVKSRKL